MNITFVTGNKRKVKEAQLSCTPFDIQVTQESIHIDEIQSHDPVQIAFHKAESAFNELQKPIVVNDAFWHINALNGFPGGYAKDVMQWFTPDDFLRLMNGKEDRSAVITDCVVYKDARITKLFTTEFDITFALEPKGIGNSIEQVAIYNGRTLAEYHERNEDVAKAEDQAWHDFAQWFTTYSEE